MEEEAEAESERQAAEKKTAVPARGAIYSLPLLNPPVAFQRV